MKHLLTKRQEVRGKFLRELPCGVREKKVGSHPELLLVFQLSSL
jgi:hypothetical protein